MATGQTNVRQFKTPEFRTFPIYITAGRYLDQGYHDNLTATINIPAFTKSYTFKFAKGYIGGGGTGSTDTKTDRIGFGLCGNGAEWVQMGGVGMSSNDAVSITYKKVGDLKPAASNSLNEARAFGGRLGTTISSGLYFGGITNYFAYMPVTTSEKNNSSNVWSVTTDILQGLYKTAYAGTATAGMLYGGCNDNEFSYLTTTQKLSSTTWSNITSAPVGLSSHAGCGTSTSAIFSGGFYDYDIINDRIFTLSSSTWKTEPEMLNIPKFGIGAVGTKSLAIFGGGSNGYLDPIFYRSPTQYTYDFNHRQYFELYDGTTVRILDPNNTKGMCYCGYCGGSINNFSFMGGGHGITFNNFNNKDYHSGVLKVDNDTGIPPSVKSITYKVIIRATSIEMKYRNGNEKNNYISFRKPSDDDKVILITTTDETYSLETLYESGLVDNLQIGTFTTNGNFTSLDLDNY